MHLYGQFLHYDGNTRIAQVRRNVKLVGRNTELTTTALDFDLGKNVGYYTNHADIISGDNNLSSQTGILFQSADVFFQRFVILRNPEYTMFPIHSIIIRLQTLLISSAQPRLSATAAIFIARTAGTYGDG